MLSSRNITWRDLQHLVVLTSKRRQLQDKQAEHQWQLNGAGLKFNHLFGFGVLDAGDLADLSSTWKPLPNRHHCDSGYQVVNRTFNATHPLKVTFDVSGCVGQSTEVNFLEHAQAFITIQASRRGDVKLFLTSPMKTRSMLLKRRPYDADARFGLRRWPFMTTQTWAENPRGVWTLEAELDTGPRRGVGTADANRSATFVEFKLVMHGTKEPLYHNQDDKGGAHARLAAVKKAHEGPLFKMAADAAAAAA